MNTNLSPGSGAVNRFFPIVKPRAHRLRLRRQAGVTLQESLVSLTIIGILSSLAAGAGQVYRDYATTAEVNDLIGNLQYARSVAIMQRTSVTLCRSDTGEACTKDSNWADGWIVFTDANRDKAINEDDRLLLVRAPLTRGSTLRYGADSRYYVIYSSTGMMYPNGTFTFCDPRGRPKAIIVYWTGRPRISTRGASNKTLSCT